jgi:hypothetical protein
MVRSALVTLSMSVFFLSLESSQQAPLPIAAATGTVAGHVMFAESRQPARLVEVTLALRPTADEVKADASDDVPEKKPTRTVAIFGRSGLDGSFVITGVPVGEYYAIAKMGGYVLPIGPITSEKQAMDVDTVMREIPRVSVAANETAEVNITLHRGGIISGRVQFEDGTPVIEAFINAELADAEEGYVSVRPFYLEQALRMESDRVLTDDEGRFRIVGLRPGKYTLSTTVTTSGGERLVSNGESVNFRNAGQGLVMIPFFAPAAFRKKDARVFEIKGSEHVADASIEIRLSQLYTVRGKVLAKEDRHAPNQAYVLLKDETDKTFRRGTRVQEDGTFTLEQVPAGTFTLTVAGARDVADPDASDQQVQPVVLRVFDDVKLDVMVDEDENVPDILLKEKVKAN